MKINKGISVVAAGTGINLALGVLYSWSIFKESIKASIQSGGAGGFDWNAASINDPYALACLVFAFTMIVAGRLQDRFGARVTAFLGGLLVGSGFLLISATTSYWLWLLGFGVLVGTGIACGYASATPAAVKWFPAKVSGLVTGIVVSGFGLASAYIAPLSSWMVKQHGLSATMQMLGLAFLVVVSLLSLLLVPPPADHKPAFQSRRDPAVAAKRAEFPHVDETPATLLRKGQFWTLWVLYFISAGAGLMVIGSISGMAKLSMGEQAFLAVAILAIGNAAGRVIAGSLSDRFGRRRVLTSVLALQAALMFLAVFAASSGSAWFIVLVATAVGFNYGANLAIFPSYAKDLWGMPHFGANYGLLFTAWGVGGFVMSRLSEWLRVETGNYSMSFIVAGVLLCGGVAIKLTFRDHKSHARAATAQAATGVKLPAETSPQVR